MNDTVVRIPVYFWYHEIQRHLCEITNLRLQEKKGFTILMRELFAALINARHSIAWNAALFVGSTHLRFPWEL